MNFKNAMGAESEMNASYEYAAQLPVQLRRSWVAQASAPAGSGGVSPPVPGNTHRDGAVTRSRDGCATFATATLTAQDVQPSAADQSEIRNLPRRSQAKAGPQSTMAAAQSGLKMKNVQPPTKQKHER